MAVESVSIIGNCWSGAGPRCRQNTECPSGARPSIRRAPTAAFGHYALRELSCRLVVSPDAARPHFYSIYAYSASPMTWATKEGIESNRSHCWISGDGSSTPLPWQARHPVFVALAERCAAAIFLNSPLPTCWSPFGGTERTRYRTMDGVLDYCRYSADPVWRLVLYACGYRDRRCFDSPTSLAPPCDRKLLAGH